MVGSVVLHEPPDSVICLFGPGEPGGRMGCAISSTSSVSATLDTRPGIAPNSFYTRN